MYLVVGMSQGSLSLPGSNVQVVRGLASSKLVEELGVGSLLCGDPSAVALEDLLVGLLEVPGDGLGVAGVRHLGVVGVVSAVRRGEELSRARTEGGSLQGTEGQAGEETAQHCRGRVRSASQHL